MKKYTNIILSAVVASALIFTSCSEDNDPEPIDDTQNIYNTGGYFVVNEGAWGNNDGSISYINTSDELTNYIYEDANSAPLGDVVQSLTIADDKALIIVNNSQKVEIVNLNDFSSSSTITDLSYPRYGLYLGNDKVYVTNGSSAGDVKIINPSSGTVTGTITVGQGPERLLQTNNNVYVVNGGGWGHDSTVSVITPSTDAVSTTITVGDNPKDLVVDANDNLWVVCSGYTEYDLNYNVVSETNSELYKIDPSTNAVIDHFVIGELSDHVSSLEISEDGQTLYFDNNGIRSLSISATSDNSTSLVDGSFYGFSVNPDNGNIFVSSFDFVSASTLYEYSSTGTFIDSNTVGIGANSVVFQ